MNAPIRPSLSTTIAGALLALALLVTVARDARAIEIMGIADSGTFEPYPINGVPLMEAFYIRYTSGDEHVQALAVEPASPVPNPSPESSNVPAGQVFLTLQDDGRDDEIYFKVEHADVPDALVRRKTFDFCKGSCTLPLERPAADHVFVIIGFSFFFPGTDHHIRRIGLWEQDGSVHAHFADENGDDTFKFELEYAYLPPQMVARSGHESGDNILGGERRPVDICPARGPIVIRGFDFEFRPHSCWLVSTCQDQHLREIGVLTPGPNIEVYFSDKSPDSAGDRFNWGVDWAVLANVPGGGGAPVPMAARAGPAPTAAPATAAGRCGGAHAP